MNRHERRSAVRSVRRCDLITHLIPSGVPLDDHATLRNAVLHWYANIDVRRPICISCRKSFVGDTLMEVGCFLLSTPVGGPDIVATSAFCARCHETLSATEVDAIATRLLRQLAPGGQFLDPR